MLVETSDNKYKFTLEGIPNRLKVRRSLGALRKFGVDKKARKLQCKKDGFNKKLLKDMGFVFPLKIKLKQELLRFQKIGVRKIDYFNGRCLLADDMGLGKTIQSLAYTYYKKREKPVLIVAPASLCMNWEKEIFKSIPGNPKVIRVQNDIPRNFLKSNHFDYVIISYTSLANSYKKVRNNGRSRKIEQPKTGWVDFLLEKNFKILIADEAHKVKNRDSNRTKSFLKIAKKIPKAIFLTGTPVENTPLEIYTICHVLKPTIFSDRFEFRRRYCRLEYNGFGWVDTGSSNEKELHNILKNKIMIRRLKTQVMKELPEKKRRYINVPIINRKEYEEAEMDVINYIRIQHGSKKAQKAQRAQGLVKVSVLKKIISKGKMKAAKSWIKKFLKSGKKLVVFCIHIDFVEELHKYFPEISVTLYGKNTDKEKEKNKERFQTEDKIRLIFMNLDSGACGHNLTAASDTLTLEFGYNPAIHDQSEDRVLRIGQNASEVTNWYMRANDTIEKELIKLLNKKRKMTGSIVDGEPSHKNYSVEDKILSYLKRAKRKKAVSAKKSDA